MTEEQAEAQVRAAAWALAAMSDWRKAVRVLQQVANEIEQKQWEGPGNR